VLGVELDEYGYTAVERRSILLPQLSAEDGWRTGQRIVSIREGFVNAVRQPADQLHRQGVAAVSDAVRKAAAERTVGTGGPAL